jgi:hypothetical protein
MTFAVTTRCQVVSRKTVPLHVPRAARHRVPPTLQRFQSSCGMRSYGERKYCWGL